MEHSNSLAENDFRACRKNFLGCSTNVAFYYEHVCSQENAEEQWVYKRKHYKL